MEAVNHKHGVITHLNTPTGPYSVTTKVLGRGSFGVVRLGYQVKTNEEVAIKAIDIKEFSKHNEFKYLKSELMLHMELKHPHIVTFYDHCYKDDILYMIFEKMDGTLEDVIRDHRKKRKKMDPSLCQFYLRQMAESLKYLREVQIVHRDLKPENFLMKGDTLKLGDFGFSKKTDISDDTMVSRVGTPAFMSPEFFTMDRYTSNVDLWSVGIIFYYMVEGVTPHLKRPLYSAEELKERILYQDIEIPKHLNAQARDLMARLLQKKHNKRITWKEFFNHPYLLLNYDQTAVAEKWVQNIYSLYQQGTMLRIPVHIDDTVLKLKERIQEDTNLPKEDLWIMNIHGDVISDETVLKDTILKEDDGESICPLYFVEKNMKYQLERSLHIPEIPQNESKSKQASLLKRFYQATYYTIFIESKVVKVIRNHMNKKLRSLLRRIEDTLSIVTLLKGYKDQFLSLEKELQTEKWQVSYEEHPDALKYISSLKEQAPFEEIGSIYQSCLKVHSMLEDERNHIFKLSNKVSLDYGMDEDESDVQLLNYILDQLKEKKLQIEEAIDKFMTTVRKSCEDLENYQVTVKDYNIKLLEVIPSMTEIVKMIPFKEQYKASLSEMELRREANDRIRGQIHESSKRMNVEYQKELERRERFKMDDKEIQGLYPLFGNELTFSIEDKIESLPVVIVNGLDLDEEYENSEEIRQETLSYLHNKVSDMETDILALIEAKEQYEKKYGKGSDLANQFIKMKQTMVALKHGVLGGIEDDYIVSCLSQHV